MGFFIEYHAEVQYPAGHQGNSTPGIPKITAVDNRDIDDYEESSEDDEGSNNGGSKEDSDGESMFGDLE